MLWRPGVVFACALVSAVSCASAPAPGSFGTFRYVGKSRGAVPLELLPPISDYAGNIYTLNGDPADIAVAQLFESFVGGGEGELCPSPPPTNYMKGAPNSTQQSYGVHGFIGFSQDRVWYWAGDSLIAVNGTGRTCAPVLDTDPSTNSSIFFEAVLPWVRDAPSQTTCVAFIISPTDALPFTVKVDLNSQIFSTINDFQPGDATNVQFIGVGADRDANIGFVLLQYQRAGATVIEGRVYDVDANLQSSASVQSDPLPEYGVKGYLQRSSKGLVVGLIGDDRLVAFDKTGGRIIPVDKNAIQPIGVHNDGGSLWLVGTAGGQPVIASIDNNGAPGPAQVWTTSLKANDALASGINVLDDRTLPSRQAQWSPAVNATGPFPFLSPHNLWRHATSTTLWVVAGPHYEFGGGTETAFAVAPVGIAYP